MPLVPKINYSLYTTSKNRILLLTLLSCALLTDMSVGKWVIIPPGVMIVFILVCLLYIDHIKHWWASVLCLALFLLVAGRSFPRLANHGNLEVLLCISFFIVYARRIITGKGISSAALTNCFRYSLITIYFIAGFHKLNSGFFTTSGSCSAYVTQGLNLLFFDRHIVYPDILVRLLQFGTIAIEMVVPFGLLFQSTRKITAWTLLIFHFYLSLCGFSNFSAFAAFLIAGCIVNLNEQPGLKQLKAVKIYILFTIMAAIAAYLSRKFGWGTRQDSLIVNGIIYNIGMFYLFYNLLHKCTVAPIRNNTGTLPLIFAVLITLWGLQGYVGLSNTSTLTMFSNLVTEKSRSNHFIINTRYTKIWEFEEDYVAILKLPAQEMEWGTRYKIENYDLPLIEFKKLARHWSDTKEKISCTILYKGKTIYINDLANSEFSDTEWWYRFLFYRRIPKEGINQCMW